MTGFQGVKYDRDIYPEIPTVFGSIPLERTLSIYESTPTHTKPYRCEPARTVSRTYSDSYSILIVGPKRVPGIQDHVSGQCDQSCRM